MYFLRESSQPSDPGGRSASHVSVELPGEAAAHVWPCPAQPRPPAQGSKPKSQQLPGLGCPALCPLGPGASGHTARPCWACSPSWWEAQVSGRKGPPARRTPPRLSSEKMRGEFSEQVGHCSALGVGYPVHGPASWRVSPGCLRADPWVLVALPPCTPAGSRSGSGRPVSGTQAGSCGLFSRASPAAASALPLTLVARC